MVDRAGGDSVNGTSGDGADVAVTDVQVTRPLVVMGLKLAVNAVAVERDSKEGGVAGSAVGLVVANRVSMDVVRVSVTSTGVHEHADGDITGARMVQVGLSRSDELELNGLLFSFQLVSPRRLRRPCQRGRTLRRTRRACRR